MEIQLGELAPWAVMLCSFIGSIWAMSKGYTTLSARADANAKSIVEIRAMLVDKNGEPRFLSKNLYRELQTDRENRHKEELQQLIKLIEGLQQSSKELDTKIVKLDKTLDRLSTLYNHLTGGTNAHEGD